MGPGHIELGNEHELYFGELDGQITPRLKTIAEVMSPVMPSTPTDNIWGWKWTKLAFGSLNFAGAMLDVPLYEALQRTAFRPTFGAVVTEAIREFAATHRVGQAANSATRRTTNATH